jgi:magnesium chelatase family protein
MTIAIRSAIQAYPSSLIELQAAVSTGLPGLHIVGLSDSACIEARVRCLTAIRNAGFRLPAKRITVTLAPATSHTQGASLDLPIALGALVAAEAIAPLPEGLVFAGELSLTGEVLPIRGALPHGARGQGGWSWRNRPAHGECT